MADINSTNKHVVPMLSKTRLVADINITNKHVVPMLSKTRLMTCTVYDILNYYADVMTPPQEGVTLEAGLIERTIYFHDINFSFFLVTLY